MGDISSGEPTTTPTSAAARVAWTKVREAAVSAVRRGWPVLPGECRPDELGFAQLCPVGDTGDLAPVTDPAAAEDLFTRLRSVGVLLICGRGVDALEVPFRVAELLPALRDQGLTVPSQASRRRGRHRRARGDWWIELLRPGTLVAVRVPELQRRHERERRYAHQARQGRVIPRQLTAHRSGHRALPGLRSPRTPLLLTQR